MAEPLITRNLRRFFGNVILNDNYPLSLLKEKIQICFLKMRTKRVACRVLTRVPHQLVGEAVRGGWNEADNWCVLPSPGVGSAGRRSEMGVVVGRDGAIFRQT